MDLVVGAGSGPTEVMRAEHEEIEAALRALESMNDANAARATFLEAIHLARVHFLKEERVVFPSAEEVLGAETLERLGEEWARARGVVLTR
jgi:hemerythrin-like domain-containing protein